MTRRVFQACLDAGVNPPLAGFSNARPARWQNAQFWAGVQIVHVLNLAHKNADAKRIENALKQDVALSYKLLRYINSAGFGLSCKI